ncbi:hypothetical protein P5V15_001171, partial [Pogonomyrmex californicus]
SNCELAQSMNELLLSADSNQQESVVKKLDSGFLVDLEKHLGEKETTKNTNANSNESQHLGIVSANYLHYLSIEKLRKNSTSIQKLSTMGDNMKPPSIIPTLKSPPQKKLKSLMTTMDHQITASSTSPNKVPNFWQLKNINVQKPLLQNDQSNSSTGDIMNQIWQQTQNPPQQPNVCLSNSDVNHQILTSVPLTQASVNQLQDAISNTSDNNVNDHNQYGFCNVIKTTLIQTQTCLSNQIYSQNTLHSNQNSMKFLQGASDNIIDNTNEIQTGTCNVAKVTFKQTQVCSSNCQNYFQNSSNIDQSVFNLQQFAISNISSNTTNYPQYNVIKSNSNQTQTCSSTSNQNYFHNTDLFRTNNHNFNKSLNKFCQHGDCKISKVTSNQPQICSSLNQNYLPNIAPINLNDFALSQTYLQNVSMSSTSNTYGITHIQNDLQQSQNLKSSTLGLATKQQCENVLKQVKYDVEMAASLLLDQAR